jgi:pyridoxamine 5'-phosphate oxidase
MGMMERALRESDVDPDPIEQVRRWIDEAQREAVPDWDSMVVATADASGAPSARMVLLRGVDPDGFRFYSSYDSAKGRDLAANPRAALVLHWPAQGRQVRVTGRVTRMTPDESTPYWRNRPLPSRLSAWASRQSELVADRATLEAAVDEVRARFPDDDVPLPPFWGGYLVEPEEVELWQHRDDRLHDRLRYRRTRDGWVMERLQP